MTLAFQSLLMTVMVVVGTVALLPWLLRESRPQPGPPLTARSGPGELWIVETPGGQWFLNGDPRSRRELERLLRRRGGGPLVHYLPSDALPLATVTRSLGWLRTLAPGAVVLDLPPRTPPRP
ncbi:MAG: hypothetical protein VKP70_12240 [Cyanobacteriota bacterium]|nr:hypothetical protein [Cyanobacteriota bacterium]